MAAARSYFLVGDIGATNARLAVTAWRDDAVEWIHEVRVADAELSNFDAALDALFAASPVERTRIAAACLGVAGPIRDNRVRFTHRDWIVDADAIAATLGGAPVKLVNDLEAAAAGIDALRARDLAVLQRTARGARRRAPPHRCRHRPRHRLCRLVRQRLQIRRERRRACRDSRRRMSARSTCSTRCARTVERIEAEHVVCGAGLERIYATLRSENPGAESPALRAEIDRGDAAAAITRFALERNDALATDALDLFIDCYGSVAGDHALAVLPSGGVFVVGGIAAKILPRLAAGGFVACLH